MRRPLVLLVVALTAGVCPALAQDKVGAHSATFLTLPVGARQWGLGGAGAAIVDPLAGHLNPGCLGIYTLQNPIGFARNSQDWAPLLYDPGEVVNANTFALAGFPIPDPRRLSWLRMSLAFAYYRQSFEVQTTVGLWPSGTADYHSLDRSNVYTLALGIEKGIEAGVGVSLKDIMSSSSIEPEDEMIEEDQKFTVGYDYGISVRIPFQQILSEWRLLDRPIRLGPLTPEVAITCSYMWANRVGGIDGSPLPRLDRFGRTIEVRLEYRDLPLIGWLATRDDVISKVGGGEDRHEGWEVDLLGVVRFQKGDDLGPTGFESHGMSVHSAGVVRWIAGLEGDESTAILPWWASNLDIFYRTAEIEKGSNWFSGGTEFKEFGFTLNTGPLWR